MRYGQTASWLFLLAGICIALTQGRYGLAPGDVLRAVGDWWMRPDDAVPGIAETILLQVRGPRVLAALAVGAGLAVAGATFQGLFRNPLVSPDILGASAGAALGAVLGIFFSLGVLGIQSSAFAGGLLAVGLVYGVSASLRQGDPVLILILSGIVIGSLLGAGIGLVKYLADPYEQLPAITFWLLGSLSGTTARDLSTLLWPVLLGCAVLMGLRHRLNVMSLAEEEARSLGASTTALRLVLVTAATLVTSAGVALAGIVGWVGLVVPHIARFLVGPSFDRLLPARALLGGASNGLSVIFTTHDPNHAVRYADEALLMRSGGIVAHGPVDDTLNEDTLETLYSTTVTALRGATAAHPVFLAS